jgi:hypothetical protein
MLRISAFIAVVNLLGTIANHASAEPPKKTWDACYHKHASPTAIGKDIDIAS